MTGVGAKAALAILSSTTPDRFALAIFSQDEKALTAAPGVGKKLAQRILLELKDKLGGAAPAEGGISLPAGMCPPPPAARWRWRRPHWPSSVTARRRSRRAAQL